MELVLCTSSDPRRLAAAVRNAVHVLDGNQSVANIQTLNQIVSASLAQPRLNTLLLAGFAALALLLASIEVYGVITYSVTHSTERHANSESLEPRSGWWELSVLVAGRPARNDSVPAG